VSIAPRERGAALGSEAPQLFLSHSSGDATFVSELAWNLNACGVDVWLDAWELRVGDDLHERIAEAVAKSRFVGVVVGKSFDDSRWVKGEVSQALSREKSENRTLVLPLLIDAVEPPPVLGSKKFLDFSGEHYHESLVRLVGLIHDLGTQEIEQGLTETQPDGMPKVVRALRYAGYEPWFVVDSKTLQRIGEAGGVVDGKRARFDPESIAQDPGVPEAVRSLMRRLIRDWGL